MLDIHEMVLGHHAYAHTHQQHQLSCMQSGAQVHLPAARPQRTHVPRPALFASTLTHTPQVEEALRNLTFYGSLSGELISFEIHQIFFVIPSNLTLVSHMSSLHHTRLSLYQVHGNVKFFRESPVDNHLDDQYSKDVGFVDRNETIDTLYFLFEAFFDWLQHNDTVSSLRTAYASTDILPLEYLKSLDIRSDDGLIYFLDYGSLLGSFRNASIIAWDVNGDIGFMHRDLQQLPLEHEAAQWIFRQNPMYYEDASLSVYDSHNTVAARVIAKANGVFINVMPYSLIHKTDAVDDAYVYSTADFLEHEKWHRATDLFPINKTGGALKHLTGLQVPHNVEKWLLTYYDDLKAPSEHEADLGWNADYDYNAYGGWMGYDGNEADSIQALKGELQQQREEIEQLKQLILEQRK